MKNKRSARIVVTCEAKVLRQLRLETKLSMRRAGRELGLSDSYISHLETGRLNVPRGERLNRILQTYGGLKEKSFRERVRLYADRQTPQEELFGLTRLANENQARTLLNVVKALLAGPQY